MREIWVTIAMLAMISNNPPQITGFHYWYTRHSAWSFSDNGLCCMRVIMNDELTRLLQEGIDSGPSVPWDKEAFLKRMENKRKKLTEYAEVQRYVEDASLLGINPLDMSMG